MFWSCLIFMNKIHKTEEEWQRELTPEQYRVLRQKGTERAESYTEKGGEGIYRCAAWWAGTFFRRFQVRFGEPAGLLSRSRFPAKVLRKKPDTAHGMRRTEVLCAACGKPSGTRF